MKRETAERAAKWWADHLRSGAKLDHGDPSPTGNAVRAMATLLQEQERAAQEPSKIDEFEAALALILEAETNRWVDVSVDYHPDWALQQAADEVGLDLGMTTLPWKTCMWIGGDEIKVAVGYGAKPEALEPGGNEEAA